MEQSAMGRCYRVARQTCSKCVILINPSPVRIAMFFGGNQQTASSAACYVMLICRQSIDRSHSEQIGRSDTPVKQRFQRDVRDGARGSSAAHIRFRLSVGRWCCKEPKASRSGRPALQSVTIQPTGYSCQTSRQAALGNKGIHSNGCPVVATSPEHQKTGSDTFGNECSNVIAKPILLAPSAT